MTPSARDPRGPASPHPESPAATALVTGASSGIGVALARELAGRGHTLTLVARRADRLRELAGEIGGEHGVRVECIPMDLTDPAERDGLAGEVAARGLFVDVLVNNAGMGTKGLFHELPVAQEVQLVRLNVETMVALCGVFVPPMVERGRGRVLNVSSVSAFMPVPQQVTYCASKAFVQTFTEALQMDLHGTGVTATALCPGPVRTEFAGLIEGSPAPLFVEPARVAREGIDGLERGRRAVIPGVLNTANAVFFHHFPRGIFQPLARRFWPV